MAEFLTGKPLEDKITDIIWDANKMLLIVSPYIKLDAYFRKLFDKHVKNHKLHLLIVFGKNENSVQKSMAKDDFDYFKSFANVSIVYSANLHAKYYGNENSGVITSINLYDHSFKNNIEFGVYTEQGMLNALTSNTDKKAWEESMKVAGEAEVVFIKRPVIEKKIVFADVYRESEIMEDRTKDFYSWSSRTTKVSAQKKLFDYPEELTWGSNQNDPKPEREVVATKKKQEMGFCIRTGEPIPFNPSKPFCLQAYNEWAQYSNVDYKETFCHKTGQRSKGKTSMRNPILES